MGFTSILGAVVLLMVIIVLVKIGNAVSRKQWKRAAMLTIVTLIVLAAIWYGLVSFITSM